MMCEISVIVPVYNTGALICKTIDSVLQQTFSEFELLIINDGSSQETLDYIIRYSDPRLRLISQENSGIAAARNRGIGEAKGKYVAFLDHDDILEPNYLEFLYRAAEKFDTDLVQCSFRLLYDNHYQEVYKIEDLNKIAKFLQDKNWKITPAVLRYLHPMVWLRLHKREFLQKYAIVFNTNLKAGQDDIHFALQCWSCAANMAVVPWNLYSWRQHPAQHSTIRSRKLFNQLIGWDELRNQLNEKFRPLSITLELYYGMNVMRRFESVLQKEYAAAFSETWTSSKTVLVLKYLLLMLFCGAIPFRYRVAEFSERISELLALRCFSERKANSFERGFFYMSLAQHFAEKGLKCTLLKLLSFRYSGKSQCR